METFLECETMCRETPPGHVFVESLAEIDPRKVAKVARGLRDKKQRVCDPFFALSPKPIARYRWKRARLSLFRPQPYLPSFIQIHPSFRDLFAKTTITIRPTIYGDKNLRTSVFIQSEDYYRRHGSHVFTFVLLTLLN